MVGSPLAALAHAAAIPAQAAVSVAPEPPATGPWLGSVARALATGEAPRAGPPVT